MKKIVYGFFSFDILNPKEYIIIEKDNQRISDKYVDFYGDKISEYEGIKALKKGDVVIRGFYYILFWKDEDISACFRKFNFYKRYRDDYPYESSLKQSIRTKNSHLDYFDKIKKQIVDMFSRNIKIK